MLSVCVSVVYMSVYRHPSTDKKVVKSARTSNRSNIYIPSNDWDLLPFCIQSHRNDDVSSYNLKCTTYIHGLYKEAQAVNKRDFIYTYNLKLFTETATRHENRIIR